MPIVSDELDLDYIPGAAAADSTLTFANVGARIFADDPLTFSSLWAKASSPKRGSIIVTLTYDPILSRVRITATGLSPQPFATIERSTDQVRWTTVRGGQAAAVAAGTVRLDDYEFTPNVVNYYRVTAPLAVSDTFTRAVSASWGTSEVGEPWALDLGTAADFYVNGTQGVMSHSSVGANHSMTVDVGGPDQLDTTYFRIPALPTGGGAVIVFETRGRWVDNANHYCTRLVVDTAGVMTFDMRRRSTITGGATYTGGPSLTLNVSHTYAVSLYAVGTDIRARLWDVTASAVPPPWQIIADDNGHTTGNRVCQLTVPVGITNTLPYLVLFDSFTADVFAIEAGPTANYGTESITPTLTAIWLKSVARPFLNLTVGLLGNTFTYERPQRTGAFAVVGRSLPVAVTDVRGPRSYVLKARTDTDAAAADLDLILAGGDTLFLQAPTGRVVPPGGVYVAVGRVTVENPAPPGLLRFTNFEVTEVAAPGPDVVGATSSWQTVLNTYATWGDVMAANPTWADLLELVGDPSEVVVA